MDRANRIAVALARVAAHFGPEVARRLAATSARDGKAFVSAGSLGLDLATGTGGLPRGHLVEYAGPEASGKTALLYAALAAAQDEGGVAALVDAEGTADAGQLLAAGVDLDTLLLAQPASATDAFLLLTILATCGGVDALGFSTIPALRYFLPPGRLRTAAPDLAEPHEVARLVARGLRVLTAGLRDSPTVVIVTNEPTREQPAEPGRLRTTGGLALGHFAAVRVLVEPLAALPPDERGVGGIRAALTVAKHKLGPPGGRAEVALHDDRGLDRPAELLALATAAGLVRRDWRGYALGELPLGLRTRDALATLAGDRGIAARLRATLLAAGQPPRAA